LLNRIRCTKGRRMADPEIAAALEQGIELFNRQEFYEAHEIWEDAWADAQMDDRHLLQGLIQVAAGFFKLQTGMPTGTLKLLEKAEGHLRAVPPDLYGLDLPALLGAVTDWRARAQKMVEEWRTDFDAAALPRLALRMA
jgi:uncharacterized protein